MLVEEADHTLVEEAACGRLETTRTSVEEAARTSVEEAARGRLETTGRRGSGLVETQVSLVELVETQVSLVELVETTAADDADVTARSRLIGALVGVGSTGSGCPRA